MSCNRVLVVAWYSSSVMESDIGSSRFVTSLRFQTWGEIVVYGWKWVYIYVRRVIRKCTDSINQKSAQTYTYPSTVC